MEVLKPTQPTMRIATVYKYHITRWKGILIALKLKKVSDVYAQDKKQALKRIIPLNTKKGE